MLLSIIIVNWNSADYLRACLGSVYATITGLPFEVIVVDNASPVSCEEEITAEFPDIRFIQCRSNLGFARANNVGFSCAQGDFLLFLNPDTELIGCAVAKMVMDLEAFEAGGAMGCRLLNSDHTIQTSAIHRFPTIANQLFSSEFLRLKFPRLDFWGIRPLFEEYAHPVVVEAISGACMLVKREAFEAAGRFNEEFFMYAEDIDLCYMIRQKGYQVLYTGRASIVHHGGKSSSTANLKQGSLFHMKEAVYRLLRRRRGPNYAKVYRIAMTLSSAARIMVLALCLPAAVLAGRTRSVAWAISKWENILIWSFGFRIPAPPLF